jgi:hypothetical protein
MSAPRAGPSAVERAATYSREDREQNLNSAHCNRTRRRMFVPTARGEVAPKADRGLEPQRGLRTACSSGGVLLEAGVSPSLRLLWQR